MGKNKEVWCIKGRKDNKKVFKESSQGKNEVCVCVKFQSPGREQIQKTLNKEGPQYSRVIRAVTCYG